MILPAHDFYNTGQPNSSWAPVNFCCSTTDHFQFESLHAVKVPTAAGGRRVPLSLIVLVEAQAKDRAAGSPRKRAKGGDSKAPELLLTWEVLRSVYPTHTYHMEDNAAYRDIVVTRNVIAKVGYGVSATLQLSSQCSLFCVFLQPLTLAATGVSSSTRFRSAFDFDMRLSSTWCTKLTSFARG